MESDEHYHATAPIVESNLDNQKRAIIRAIDKVLGTHEGAGEDIRDLIARRGLSALKAKLHRAVDNA